MIQGVSLANGRFSSSKTVSFQQKTREYIAWLVVSRCERNPFGIHFFWKWPALRCPLSTFSYELTQISFIDDRSTYSIHSIIDEFPIDGTVKSSIVLGKIFFLVAKCLTCSIPYLPVPTNDPNMDPIELWSYDLRLNYGPFFSLQKIPWNQ